MDRLRRAPRAVAVTALALVVGITVVVAAQRYPRTDVEGSVLLGPQAHHDVRFALPDLRATAAWPGVGRPIVLDLLVRGSCAVRLTDVTSTAPGRIEAELTMPGPQRCTGRWHRATAVLPPMTEPGSGELLSVHLAARGVDVLQHGVSPATPW